MPNCYRCGRPLLDTKYRMRRKVKTGEWVRKRYGQGSAEAVQRHYGMRIVCKGCAKWIDAHDLRKARGQWIQLWIALVVLMAVVLLRLVFN